MGLEPTAQNFLRLAMNTKILITLCIGQHGLMVKALCSRYENFALVGSNPIADTKYIFIKMPFFVISVNLQQSNFISFCSELLRGCYDIGGIEEP